MVHCCSGVAQEFQVKTQGILIPGVVQEDWFGCPYCLEKQEDQTQNKHSAFSFRSGGHAEKDRRQRTADGKSQYWQIMPFLLTFHV